MLNPRHVAVSTSARSEAPSAAAAPCRWPRRRSLHTRGCELNLRARSPCSSRLPQLSVQRPGNSPTATQNMGGRLEQPTRASSSSSPGQRGGCGMGQSHRAQGCLQLEPGACCCTGKAAAKQGRSIRNKKHHKFDFPPRGCA